MLLAMLLIGTQSPPVVHAGPLPQDTRPPEGGGGGGGTGGGGGGNGGGQQGQAEPRCASLTGQVINWGFGPESGVVTQLRTGSWQVSTTSASDGNYGFGGLGVGIAVLHLELAPGQPLQPLIQDAGVYLSCNLPTIANLALYSGPPPRPPATLEMTTASPALTPGQAVEIVLTVKNGLPNDITNVIVTDLMPAGLTAIDLRAPVAFPAAQIINGGVEGQLVLVNLDRLSSGATATIRVTVEAAAGLPRNTQMRNAATLFYRESAADQAWLDLTVGGTGLPLPTAAPATPLASPEAGAAFAPPTATPSPAPSAAPTALPTATAVATEEAVPPDNMPKTGDDMVLPSMLPVTGAAAIRHASLPANIGLILFPLGGIGLASLAVWARRSRAARRQDEGS